jgi:hypothetical protein
VSAGAVREQPERLLPNEPAERNGRPFQIVLIEHPDPSGERWKKALDLLLEAGRAQDTDL